jgi:hypothetical protein
MRTLLLRSFDGLVKPSNPKIGDGSMNITMANEIAQVLTSSGCSSHGIGLLAGLGAGVFKRNMPIPIKRVRAHWFCRVAEALLRVGVPATMHSQRSLDMHWCW